MSRIKWFEGESKDALQMMLIKNCVFIVYIGTESDEFFNIFKDIDVIELLTDEVIICFKMDPKSSSFDKFKVIFNNVDIPSVYVLEKNNTEQRVLKKSDYIQLSNYHTSIKKDFLVAIKNSINDILGNISEKNEKKKYLQYLEKFDNMCMLKEKSTEKSSAPKITDSKKFDNSTKIKFIVPSKNISLIHEFKTTSLLKEIKTYAINNISLPYGPIKLTAHRNFTEEDFNRTLSELSLCPSSTIYIHPVPSTSQNSIAALSNFPLLIRLFQLIIFKPYDIIRNYMTSYFRSEQSTEIKNQSPNPNINNVKENKFVYKRSSNVHSLKDQEENRRRPKDDDDDNKTYNGNSTQQL